MGAPGVVWTHETLTLDTSLPPYSPKNLPITPSVFVETIQTLTRLREDKPSGTKQL